MRVIWAILATFVGAFVIVGFTASILETWVTARRYAVAADLSADHRNREPDLAARAILPAALTDR